VSCAHTVEEGGFQAGKGLRMADSKKRDTTRYDTKLWLFYRYLKCIDKFFNNYISCFVTAGNVKFLLLHQPIIPTGTSSRSSTAIGANPTSPATEEAIKMFFTEVYENWVKAVMSPFYRANMEVRSPVFRTRVAAAGRKYL
jgi:hypothetical protein